MQLTLFGNDYKEIVNGNIKRGAIRAKSNEELATLYRKWGTGLVKCFHERSYFVECASCKRTRSEAEDNFERFKLNLTANP